jgi:hypothetical protein
MSAYFHGYQCLVPSVQAQQQVNYLQWTKFWTLSNANTCPPPKQFRYQNRLAS